MRYPWHPQARGLRRACALAGVLCIVLGLVIFPGVTGTLPVARAGSPTKVPGPNMYNPLTMKPFDTASSVTVDQTSELVPQMVHVTWSGFTPTTQVGPPPPVFSNSRQRYPVMVAQCAGIPGDLPTEVDRCFGATTSGVSANLTANGPMNTVYALTDAQGNGQVDIRILTSVENQLLGCDQTHDCSLVIVPAQGGLPPQLSANGKVDCSNHTLDARNRPPTSSAYLSFRPPDASSTLPCAWAKRITVPLHFAPTPANCPFTKADFSLIGSPVAARAIDQWRAGICRGTNPLPVQYNSAVNEPLARTDFLDGSQDMALTTRPVATTTTGKYSFSYAPVSVTGVAIAYWIDDATSGLSLPVTDLKLNQRLVAKLLTASYAGIWNCPFPPTEKRPCNSAVTGNASNLFYDPEFKLLNPTVRATANSVEIYPTVGSGNSDLTYEVTRWIASSAEAVGFLNGIKDPYGTRVNDHYKGTVYPTESFTVQDPHPAIEHGYSPVFPLNLTASYQAANWTPATEMVQVNGNYPKVPPSAPGLRAQIAIVPLADAVAYHFPVAAILNGGGQYVTPTPESLAAALAHMTTNPDGVTQQVDMAGKDPAAYPLTMVQYAMAPTGGIAKDKAAKMAAFLDFAASFAGQRPGTAPGTLPAGMLPLTAAQQTQTTKVAKDVQCQTGDKKTPGGTWCPSPTPTPSATSTSASPTATVTTTATSTTGTGTGTGTGTTPNPSSAPAPVITGVKNTLKAGTTPGVSLPVVAPAGSAAQRPADEAGFTRFLLPVLLLVAGLLAVGGPALFVFGNTPWGAAMVREVRSAFTGRITP